MAIRSKPIKILLITSAALFVIVALITLVTVLIFDRLFIALLYKQLALLPGSAVYANWIKPTVPIYFSVYLFNLTNLDDVLKGAAPRLQEVGPYVYRETRERYDLEFPDENPPSVVRFKHRIFYHYVPEMSVAPPEEGLITIPNLLTAVRENSVRDVLVLSAALVTSMHTSSPKFKNLHFSPLAHSQLFL
ncbi:unnamed protein product [Echinostoma caproni]|uniref:Scavenger receptor class B member 1 n=1 Tax=Echinostoma caproni TaxID=27848 RepID=A0A183B6A7_9TREM|nr:unnamed protein product [Echinostoma caproni]